MRNLKNNRILILQATLSIYNSPIFDLVAKECDLTVAYFIKNEIKNDNNNFNILKLEHIKIKSLYVNINLLKTCQDFDVVIFMGDLHCLSYISLPFLKRSFKTIFWSIGTRASLTRRYDLNRKFGFIEWILGQIIKKTDACLFYMKQPIDYWIKHVNIPKEKFFVAHNTLEVLPYLESNKKNSILFIGSLYQSKKIEELILAYHKVSKNFTINEELFLNIVGSGPEQESLKNLVNQLGLNNSIIFHGAIYDEIKIRELFSLAYVCVSPDQAGLSVLKSMGYGVPFVTRKNAYTGGERLNIIDEYNGLLYNAEDELVKILSDLIDNKNKFKEMGNNAHTYYNTFATPKIMASGILNAIRFTLHH